MHRDQHDRKLWGVLGQIFSATESNRFTAESQNLWGEIFMAPHHFFGYNDARNVFEVSKVLLPEIDKLVKRSLDVYAYRKLEMAKSKSSIYEA